MNFRKTISPQRHRGKVDGFRTLKVTDVRRIELPLMFCLSLCLGVSGETTSHSTKVGINANQVAGYVVEFL
jgi:hypothetical protein